MGFCYTLYSLCNKNLDRAFWGKEGFRGWVTAMRERELLLSLAGCDDVLPSPPPFRLGSSKTQRDGLMALCDLEAS